ncbi:zinc ribbon domain-containing protein [bacterium]|nr:zinc ribbon domain-containing protein [bacterium]
MKCQNCDAENESGTFCGKCGARLKTSDLATPSSQQGGYPTYEPSQKKSGGAIGWVISIVIVVIVAFAFFANGKGNVFTSGESTSQSQEQAIADAQAKQAAADEAAAQAAADAAEAQASLPTATTVVEAVTSAIYAYCPSSNATQWNQANWFLSSSPTSPPVEGYWELYAPTSGGDYVYVHVIPNADGSIVSVVAASNYGQQAFDHWGCPASMDVAVYAEDYN